MPCHAQNSFIRVQDRTGQDKTETETGQDSRYCTVSARL